MREPGDAASNSNVIEIVLSIAPLWLIDVFCIGWLAFRARCLQNTRLFFLLFHLPTLTQSQQTCQGLQANTKHSLT